MSSDTGIDFLRDFIRQATPDGLFMEFGVATGASIKRLAGFVPGVIYGFDSFEGLPEEWTGRGGMAKGSFRCEPPTDLPANVRIVKGLFQDTLPGFLEEHPEPASFVHIDSDLYSSAIFVLRSLKDRLNGAIVAFDELYNIPCYEEHEGAALRNFLSESGYSADLLGKHNDYSGCFRFYHG